MPFNCEKCGACCRAIKCQLLSADNSCPLYENRPTICSVDKMYDLLKWEMTRSEFYKLNKMYCKLLREKEVHNGITVSSIPYDWSRDRRSWARECV